jgi:hypothetical protein
MLMQGNMSLERRETREELATIIHQASHLTKILVESDPWAGLGRKFKVGVSEVVLSKYLEGIMRWVTWLQRMMPPLPQLYVVDDEAIIELSTKSIAWKIKMVEFELVIYFQYQSVYEL